MILPSQSPNIHIMAQSPIQTYEEIPSRYAYISHAFNHQAYTPMSLVKNDLSLAENKVSHNTDPAKKVSPN